MGRWDGLSFGGLTCAEFVELVTDYLEDRLDASARTDFEQHVADCPGCADYLEQIRESQRALGHVRLDTLSDQARGQLLDAFRDWRSGRGAS